MTKGRDRHSERGRGRQTETEKERQRDREILYTDSVDLINHNLVTSSTTYDFV